MTNYLNSNSHKVAVLDWDGTCSLAPGAFVNITKILKEEGFKVYLCTMRRDENERFGQDDPGICAKLASEVDAVFYTNRKAKKKFLNELGVFPSFWVDDRPDFILHDASH